MASWMALVTSRDIDACVLLLQLLLLLLLLRGFGVGRTKTSMCLGVATAHAGYLPGSQGAIAGARAAGSRALHGSRAKARRPSRGKGQA